MIIVVVIRILINNDYDNDCKDYSNTKGDNIKNIYRSYCC